MNRTKKERAEELWQGVTDFTNDDRTFAHSELMKMLSESGQHDEAIQVGYTWLEYEESVGGMTSLAWSAHRLVSMLSDHGRREEAISVAKRILDQPNLWIPSNWLGHLHWLVAMDLGALGNITEQVANYRKAIEFFDPSIYGSILGTIHSRLGDALFTLGLFNEASANFVVAVSYLEEAEESDEVAEAKLGLSKTLFEQRHYSMARKYAEEASAIFDFCELTNESNEALTVLGRIASATGDSGQAEALLKRAAIERFGTEDRKTAAKAMYYWAEHLATLGRDSEAREEFAKLNPVLRSLGLNEMADSTLSNL